MRPPPLLIALLNVVCALRPTSLSRAIRRLLALAALVSPACAPPDPEPTPDGRACPEEVQEALDSAPTWTVAEACAFIRVLLAAPGGDEATSGGGLALRLDWYPEGDELVPGWIATDELRSEGEDDDVPSLLLLQGLSVDTGLCGPGAPDIGAEWVAQAGSIEAEVTALAADEATWRLTLRDAELFNRRDRSLCAPPGEVVWEGIVTARE